jgi:hypothetical protein
MYKVFIRETADDSLHCQRPYKCSDEHILPGHTDDQASLLAKDAGMNYDMLARAIGVSQRSIDGWLTGREPEHINRV